MANTLDWAGQFRGERQASRNGSEPDYDRSDLRQVKKVRKTKVMKKKITKSTNGAKMATNRLLSSSWLALIPSFGLSLIWINTHAFMHMLFPGVFGKLGEEWVPGQAKAGEAINKPARMVEKMALFLLDLLAIMVMLGAIVLIMMVIQMVFGVFSWLISWFV